MMLPERPNLRYFLLSGPSAPTCVLQLPIVTNFLMSNTPGLMMIYVQTLDDGSSIFMELHEFSVANGLVTFPSTSTIPKKEFAFLHSNLTEGSKTKIIQDALNMKIRILIATSSAGAGVHLPISIFVGWGLDRKASSIVQASGRTARGAGKGDVVWVHNPSIHGRRVPGNSAAREMLSGKCLRACQNDWFGEEVIEEDSTVRLEPHDCCSVCMSHCIKEGPCVDCARALRLIEFDERVFMKNVAGVKCFEQFLRSLDLESKCPPGCPPYEVSSLAKAIISHLDETKSIPETKSFLEIFALGEELCRIIGTFLEDEGLLLFSKYGVENKCENDSVLLDSEESDASTENSDDIDTESEEYFDE